MAHVRRRENRIDPGKEWGTWRPFFTVAILLRIFLTLARPYEIDMYGYFTWSRYLADIGTTDFYSTFHVVYAPAYQYLLWITGEIAVSSNQLRWQCPPHQMLVRPCRYHRRLSALSHRNPNRASSCGIRDRHTLFHESRRSLRFLDLGPVRRDAALFMLLVLLLFLEKKPVAAALVFLLSVLTKPQSGLLAPIVLIAFIHAMSGMNWKSRLKAIGLTLGAGIAEYLAIVLPFYEPTSLAGRVPGWLDPFWWLFDLYFRSVKDYPYATANAFNLWYPLGGQVLPDSTPLLGLSMSVWGYLLVAAGFLLAGWFLLRKPHHPGRIYFASWIALFSSFLFMTKMHERYLVPALLIGAACVLYESRLLWPYLLVSAVTAFNQWVVYDLSWSLQYWLPVADMRAFTASILLLVAYAWTLVILFRNPSVDPAINPLPGHFLSRPAAAGLQPMERRKPK